MKIRYLTLIFLFFLGLSPNAFAKFSDIQKDSLDYMYHQNIIDGYSDGTFRPKTTISRAELVKLLMAGAQIKPLQSKPCFKDLGEGEWYVNWVCTAKEKGWIAGYDDGTFKPLEEVNHAEASKIIVNILGLPPGENVVRDEDEKHVFSDVSKESWFYPYVNALDEKYYLDWTKTFGPANPINREDVAEIVFRNLLTKNQYEPLEAQNIFANWPTDPKKISENESLALDARDFFRSQKIIENLSLAELAEAQKEVVDWYEYAKKTYTFTSAEAEKWNYKIMMEDGPYTYGVLHFYNPNQELFTHWRDGFQSWAILKFDTTSQKLLAYDFFTRRVDRPSLYPNIVSIADDKVTLQIGQGGPDPAYMVKEGPELEIQLRNFR